MPFYVFVAIGGFAGTLILLKNLKTIKIMVLFIFAFIVLVHGLIHLLGFLKEFDLAKVDELSGKTLIPISENTAKFAGIFWLVSSLLFVACIVLILLNKEWWWMLGITAVVISQVLIVLYWQDAKFGTIANIIILGGILLAFGSWNFQNEIRSDLRSFTTPQVKDSETISLEMIANLPEPVQKWLKKSQVIGKEKIHSVYLKQTGEMKTKPEGNWIPVLAEQYFNVDDPGFLWIADVKAAPFFNLAGKDKYLDGKGHMKIKALSLLPVVNSTGNEIDQGTMVRYLAEIVWFPSAALNNYIQWEQLDSYSARAILKYSNMSVSGIYFFNEEGDVTGFEAQRYYDRTEGATLETWSIKIDPKSLTEFEGIKIPVSSEVTWKFREGDFTWYKLTITDVTFNCNIQVLPIPTKNLVNY